MCVGCVVCVCNVCVCLVYVCVCLVYVCVCVLCACVLCVCCGNGYAAVSAGYVCVCVWYVCNVCSCVCACVGFRLVEGLPEDKCWFLQASLCGFEQGLKFSCEVGLSRVLDQFTSGFRVVWALRDYTLLVAQQSWSCFIPDCSRFSGTLSTPSEAVANTAIPQDTQWCRDGPVA